MTFLFEVVNSFFHDNSYDRQQGIHLHLLQNAIRSSSASEFVRIFLSFRSKRPVHPDSEIHPSCHLFHFIVFVPLQKTLQGIPVVHGAFLVPGAVRRRATVAHALPCGMRDIGRHQDRNSPAAEASIDHVCSPQNGISSSGSLAG